MQTLDCEATVALLDRYRAKRTPGHVLGKRFQQMVAANQRLHASQLQGGDRSH
jgi:hypothetical protein